MFLSPLLIMLFLFFCSSTPFLVMPCFSNCYYPFFYFVQVWERWRLSQVSISNLRFFFFKFHLISRCFKFQGVLLFLSFLVCCIQSQQTHLFTKNISSSFLHLIFWMMKRKEINDQIFHNYKCLQMF